MSTQDFKKATLPGASVGSVGKKPEVEDESEDEELEEKAEDSDEESEAPVEKPVSSKAAKADRAAKVAAARKLLAEEEANFEYDPSANIGDLNEDRRFTLSDKAVRTREYLARQKLIMVTIPRDPSESKDAVHGFNINGFGFTLPKGKYVNVPQDIAKMISDTHGQDLVLASNHPLNLANNKDAAKEFAR